MKILRSLGNLPVSVPRLAAMATLAVAIGVAAAGVATSETASAGDARFTERATNVPASDSATTPAKPRKLTASRLDDGSVELTWRKPKGDVAITGYKITYTSPSSVGGSLTETITSGFTETPITNDKGRVTGVLVTFVKQVGADASIRYQVRAYNNEGDGVLSRQARAPRIGKPAEIFRWTGNLEQMTICWSRSDGDPTHYEVMRRFEDSKPKSILVIATVADDSGTSDNSHQCYTDVSAAADVDYVYKVRGTQGDWTGRPSAALIASRTASNDLDE